MFDREMPAQSFNFVERSGLRPAIILPVMKHISNLAFAALAGILTCPGLSCSSKVSTVIVEYQHQPDRPAQRQNPRQNLRERPVNWSDVRRNPAELDVFNMEPIPLSAGVGKKAWVRIPDQLEQQSMLIYMPTGPCNGVADYKVTRAGFLLVACNYDYQGHGNGDWQKRSWEVDDFKDNGWRELTEAQLGGVLVKGDNREQIIFIKRVSEGENGRLRCNKYDPPYFIVEAGRGAQARR